MAEIKKKKARNPNFSSKEEKGILLECVFDEKHIIENKRTDGTTWKEKEAAWERISVKFNSTSDSSCFRITEALRKFYQGYKKEVRKMAADEKMSTMQTGGGKPLLLNDENFELAISIMNPKTISGFENNYDGDGVDALLEDELSSSMHVIEEISEEITTDWAKYKPSQLKNPVHPKLKPCQGNIAKEHEALSIEKSPKTHEGVQIPMSKGFKKQFSDSLQESKWCGRRRPVASTLSSSKITEQYSELSAIKIELAKLQYETLKEEANQKKYSNSIEHELRKRSLELDIEIESEILKKVKNDSKESVDACSILRDLKNLNP